MAAYIRRSLMVIIVVAFLAWILNPRMQVDSATAAGRAVLEPTSEWGPPIVGNRVRVRAPKYLLEHERGPRLLVDFDQIDSGRYSTNQTAADLLAVTHHGLECYLSFDGHWYRWTGIIAIAGVSHHRMSVSSSKGWPGTLPLTEKWCRVSDDQPLKLLGGKHTVQVAWAAYYPKSDDPMKPDLKLPTMLTTGQLEIDISL